MRLFYLCSAFSAIPLPEFHCFHQDYLLLHPPILIEDCLQMKKTTYYSFILKILLDEIFSPSYEHNPFTQNQNIKHASHKVQFSTWIPSLHKLFSLRSFCEYCEKNLIFPMIYSLEKILEVFYTYAVQ